MPGQSIHIRCLCYIILFIFGISQGVIAQNLDSKPYSPEVDSDIDLYISNWRESRPFHTHGCLVERDVLSKGNPAKPERKGAVLKYVNTIVFDPMTIGHPHSHREGCEEVWTSIEGTSLLFLGKQIRWQPPGTAYMIPPDYNTPHSNINHTDKPVKLLYFAVRKDWEEKDGIKRSTE